MILIIHEMISYSFINRALLVGTLVSLCAALLGVSLVLKRYSNIGDGLAHVGFGITTIAVAFGLAPLPIAIPSVIVIAIILLKIGNNHRIKSDSAIAIISSTSLALGVAVTSLTTGLNTDVCNAMFGSGGILAMSNSDVILSILVSIIVLMLFIVYYRKLFAVTFDEDFSKAIGLKTQRYTNLIAILTAVVIVIGMRLMGTLLISSIIIFPALTSMRLFKTFKSVVISSGIVSVICFWIGMFLSYVYGISTGATIVLVNLVVFLLFTVLEKTVK